MTVSLFLPCEIINKFVLLRPTCLFCVKYYTSKLVTVFAYIFCIFCFYFCAFFFVFCINAAHGCYTQISMCVKQKKPRRTWKRLRYIDCIHNFTTYFWGFSNAVRPTILRFAAATTKIMYTSCITVLVRIAEIHLVKLKKRIKIQTECKTTFIKTNLNENLTKRNVIMNENVLTFSISACY